MIEKRLPEDQTMAVPRSMTAMATAAGQLAILRMWFAGEASCSADALAGQLTAQGNLDSDGRSTANSAALRTNIAPPPRHRSEIRAAYDTAIRTKARVAALPRSAG